MSTKRFIPLRTRLLLSVVPLLLLFMAFNFVVILHHETRNLTRETEKRASSLAAGLSILSAEAMLTFSTYLLDQNTARFGSLPDVAYCMVLGPAATRTRSPGAPSPQPLNASNTRSGKAGGSWTWPPPSGWMIGAWERSGSA
jgi:hypothetical protein